MDTIETHKIRAGRYPAAVISACNWLFIAPEDLIDWALRSREVVLILPDGSKATFPLSGKWRPNHARPCLRPANPAVR